MRTIALLLTLAAGAQAQEPSTTIDAEATRRWCDNVSAREDSAGWVLRGVALGAPSCDLVSGAVLMSLRVYEDGTRWLIITGPRADIYRAAWSCFDASSFRVLGPAAPNVTILERAGELARLVVDEDRVIIHMAPRGTPMHRTITESMRELGATPTPDVL
jgi:hypothetical protein